MNPDAAHRLSDAEIDEEIAHAIELTDGDGLPALVELRDRLHTERDLSDPVIARVWDALVRVAARVPEDFEDFLFHAEGRARWRSAALGSIHPDTIAAWSELAETAEAEGAWDIAMRSWGEIAGAPIDRTAPPFGGADDRGQAPVVDDVGRVTQLAISRALRGLGARKLVGGQLAEARVLFERDLAVNERLYPTGDPQLAISVGNLALVIERQGDRLHAHQLRRRQRDLLAAIGAPAGQLASLDAQLARLV